MVLKILEKPSAASIRRKQMETTKALYAGILFCVFYASQIVLQQFFVKSTIFPLHLDFLTNLSAFILLTLYFMIFKRDAFKIKLNKKSFILFLAATFLWILADVSSIFGLKDSSSINLSIISRLQIIITYFLAVMFFGESISKNKVIASVLSFIGGLIIVYDFQTGFRINPGDILFFVFTVTISLSGLIRQKVTTHMSALQMSYLMFGVSSAVLGAVTFLFFPIKSVTIPGFIILNSVISLVGFIFVNASIALGGATFFSIVSSLLPVFTAILSFIFLKQLPLFTQVIGAVIITLGIILFQKNENRKSNISRRNST